MMPMSILFPLGLLALLSLPIILLLHLRRERLQRVVVPSLLLWQNLPRAEQGEKRRVLPISLLLLLHLLAAGLLSMALAQPEWLGAEGDQERHVAIIIDTSTSMRAHTLSGNTRFDEARQQARDQIISMGPYDIITLIAAGPQAQFLTSGGKDATPALLAALNEMMAGGVGSDMMGAFTLAQAAHRAQPRRVNRILVLSDLDAPTQAALPDNLVQWVRVGDMVENCAIVALDARPRTGGGTDIYVRIANYGYATQSFPVHFQSDGVPRNTEHVTISPDSELSLTLQAGGTSGIVHVELEHADALLDDNRASISLARARAMTGLLVTEPSDSATRLRRALQALPNLTIREVAPADYGAAIAEGRIDLTIFNNTIPIAWPAGGVLVINPPIGTSLLTVTESLYGDSIRVREVVGPGLEHHPFEGLSLESVAFGGIPKIEPPAWAASYFIVEDRATGATAPLLMHGHIDTSSVAIWAFDLGRNQLTTRLVFPLLVARTVQQLTPPLPEPIRVGMPLILSPDPRTDTLDIRAPDGQTWTIAPITGTVELQGLQQSGVYHLTERQGEITIAEVHAVVHGSTPQESDLRPRPMDAAVVLSAQSMPATGATGVPASEHGFPLWRWLALAALAIVVIEWLYIHR